jgi:hypothetical protein
MDRYRLVQLPKGLLEVLFGEPGVCFIEFLSRSRRNSKVDG